MDKPKRSEDHENKGMESQTTTSDVEGITEKTAEIGGVQGPEPTRYGDWEKNGRCIDF